MIQKMILLESGFLSFILLAISDAVAISIVTGVVSIITLIVQGVINARVNKISKQQDIIHKQIDGQQDALMNMTAQAKFSQGKLETKDEVIEILKQTEPLGDAKKEEGKPIDVVVTKNLDKLL